MTDINTILDDNWDTDICAKPSFIKFYSDNYRAYKRVIATSVSNIDDEVIGLMDRLHFSVDSHDGYTCLIATTTKADMLNILKAMKKSCIKYDPTSAESMIKWEGGSTRIFNAVLFEIRLIIIINKAGVLAY